MQRRVASILTLVRYNIIDIDIVWNRISECALNVRNIQYEISFYGHVVKLCVDIIYFYEEDFGLL